MRYIAFFCFAVCLAGACTSKRNRDDLSLGAPPASALTGRELALAHCSSCHTYVGPEMLPKPEWESVLGAMGNFLGIYNGVVRPDSLFAPGMNGMVVRNANIFPEKPVIAPEDWQKILAYYRENAPDSISPPTRKSKIRMGLKHFRYKESPVANRPALTSMVKILPNKQGIAFSDGKGANGALTFLKPDLTEQYRIPLPATPVQMQPFTGGMYVAAAGKGIFPTDAPDGALMQLNKSGDRYLPGSTVLSDLKRPVCMAWGDLDQDGDEDVVVCEFGNFTGELSWFENNGRGGYDRRTLRSKPGAISAIIKDANGDGLPDIYVLTAQADEAILLYENQGGGKFLEKRLLTFSPLNGSQYIELADFNQDGHDDILYVAGDNADKSPILKDYHGIYIFLNDGKNNFSQSFFYQMNGAYKAMVRDFDNDGDLDIAAISFFPDYAQYPEESFIYLENKGKMTFDDYSFPEAANGRWIVMDAGDIDGDGDIDLVLGSFVYFIPAGDTTGLGQRWVQTGPSVAILENTTR